jgi:hypothetical protein
VQHNSQKTHCPKGHEYAVGNTIIKPQHGYDRRVCRTCHNERRKIYRANAKEAPVTKVQAYVPAGNCPHGLLTCGMCKRLVGYSREVLVNMLGLQDVYKPDANQAEIVKALRAVGCSVEIITSPIGRAGIPDLLVGFKGVNYLIEIKVPGTKGTPPDKEDLSEAQLRWHMAWKGAIVRIVTTTEEALLVVGAIR